MKGAEIEWCRKITKTFCAKVKGEPITWDQREQRVEDSWWQEGEQNRRKIKVADVGEKVVINLEWGKGVWEIEIRWGKGKVVVNEVRVKWEGDKRVF